MGGGGAMRAATKAAGIGAFNAGIRGGGAAIVFPPHPPEHSVRNDSRLVSAIISHNNNNGSDGAVASATQTGSVQKPATWELDDWEFAGLEAEEDMVVMKGSVSVVEPDPIPRVVFGGAPSLEDAKAATSELKDALEKVYLSAPSHGESFGVSKHPGLSLMEGSVSSETKSCVMFEPKVTVPPPKYAVQAFTLLNESPAVQSVVASIASDPIVWDAVLKNPELQEYLQSCKTCEQPNSEEFSKVVESNNAGSPRKLGAESDAESEDVKSGNGFTGFLEDVKHSVVEMASDIVAFVQNVFGFQSAEHVTEADSGKGKDSVFESNTLGRSFMALAVMVIMVVLLKRA